MRCGKLAMAQKLAGSAQGNLRSQSEVVIKGHVFHTDSAAERVALAKLCTLRAPHLVRDQNAVDPIPYTHNGKSHFHRPDFAVPSERILVEVKSPATLGISKFWSQRLTSKAVLARVISKTKAAQELGYKYRIIVVLGRGGTAHARILPIGWEIKYNTPARLRKWLGIDFGNNNG
jgi:hypothetical protein